MFLNFLLEIRIIYINERSLYYMKVVCEANEVIQINIFLKIHFTAGFNKTLFRGEMKNEEKSRNSSPCHCPNQRQKGHGFSSFDKSFDRKHESAIGPEETLKLKAKLSDDALNLIPIKVFTLHLIAIPFICAVSLSV